MTNQQWPPPRQDGRSPWAQQDPDWRPPQFHDAQGRDPRQPFGQAPTSPPAFDLEPPKRFTPALFAMLGVVVVVAALILGMQFFGTADPGSSASPSVSPTPPPPTRTGNWIPFEGNGNGAFEVLSSAWGDNTLTVTIRVEVESGEHSFMVFAFSDESRLSYEPVQGGHFTAGEAEPFEGTFEFEMPREDSTLVLSTPSGRVALNALPIPA